MGWDAVLDEFRPGRTIVLPGGPAELSGLTAALTADPDRLSGVHLVCPMIPGVNGFDYTALHPEARLTTFLLPPALRGGFERGQVRVLPLPYSRISRYLAELEADLALLHLTPAEHCRHGFGVSADFGTAAASGARRRIGVINGVMPRPARSASLDAAKLHATVEIDAPLPGAPEARDADADLLTLAGRVADLIPDGAAVQTGIGTAPDSLWGQLHDRRGLRLRSGMITDAVLAATDAGALAPDGHLSGIAWGSNDLYARLDGSDFVRFAPVEETHGAALADLDGFVAVNSALEVDLFGQANLEWRNGAMSSGVGGAPDFASAAARSRGGRSIIALPSTARRGSVSRIVLKLTDPASLSRSTIDTVVTEHGVAHLATASLDERAEALIAIAAPAFRAQLSADWDALRRRL